ncbi:hypothetical protein E3N88_14754 [Mikania micrantha]|uniref:C2H2-type domain-containing protein n=1 Tax=Mikania micrantha TaxID=192012 RepID=A0A5N6P2C1_9ASTR|nr:hypothetical protein E3N88_14754 [Mikania micrantha]
MVTKGSNNIADGPNPNPPPPPSPPPGSAGTKRPMMPKEKSVICPVCNRNMYHEKALNGHIRWHTAQEREAAGLGTARSLASTVVVEEQDAPKRAKVPDLNRSPPPEDEEP